MRTAYKVLAYLLALQVVVQAAAISFAVAGLGIFVEDGNTVDSATFEAIFEGDVSFTGVLGLMVHGTNGMMVIPAMSLVLLVVSFFARVPHGVAVAGALLGLVVLQVALGILGHSIAAMGALHGVNALVLFMGAMHAGRLAGASQRVTETEGDYVAA